MRRKFLNFLFLNTQGTVFPELIIDGKYYFFSNRFNIFGIKIIIAGVLTEIREYAIEGVTVEFFQY